MLLSVADASKDVEIAEAPGASLEARRPVAERVRQRPQRSPRNRSRGVRAFIELRPRPAVAASDKHELVGERAKERPMVEVIRQIPDGSPRLGVLVATVMLQVRAIPAHHVQVHGVKESDPAMPEIDRLGRVERPLAILKAVDLRIPHKHQMVINEKHVEWRCVLRQLS